MALTSFITRAHDWTEKVPELHPGAHVVVLAEDSSVGVDGRLLGLELRDTILVVRPGPSAGFVFLFRMPLVGPVAEQVLKTGTGGLNVDACRVGTSKPHVKNRPFEAWRNIEGRSDRQQPEQTYDPNTGRWPPNVVLVHGPECRPAECEDGCPVKVLDAQGEAMGMHSAGAARDGSTAKVSDNYTASSYEMPPNRNMRRLGDSGGASRFFPQFKDEIELHAWLTTLVTV